MNHIQILRDALKAMVERYKSTSTECEDQPKTFGCHHHAETCKQCESMVTGWKVHKVAREALAATSAAEPVGAVEIATISTKWANKISEGSVSTTRNLIESAIAEYIAAIAARVPGKPKAAGEALTDDWFIDIADEVKPHEYGQRDGLIMYGRAIIAALKGGAA